MDKEVHRDGGVAPTGAFGIATRVSLELVWATLHLIGQERESQLALTHKESRTPLEIPVLTDAEIKRLQMQLAIAQTSRNAYARALTEAVKLAVPAGDTFKLG